MESREFAMAQTLLISAATVVRGLDLDAFIEACSRASTLGTVLDPTLYRENLEAGNPLQVLHDLAVAARKFERILPTTCRKCGCTDEKACEDGCSWIAPGLCSSCAPVEAAAAR